MITLSAISPEVIDDVLHADRYKRKAIKIC